MGKKKKTPTLQQKFMNELSERDYENVTRYEDIMRTWASQKDFSNEEWERISQETALVCKEHSKLVDVILECGYNQF